MLETITLEDAQAHLAELITRLVPGSEVLITHNDRPVARLIGQPQLSPQPRKPGSAIGKLIIHADDDEHLKDFQEYMQ
ncbi:MAG: type II toxin-antitoxin system Phd/YefM family antitoxin [Blastocatellia bacterium]